MCILQAGKQLKQWTIYTVLKYAQLHTVSYLTAILINDRTATSTVTMPCMLFSDNTGIIKLLLLPVSINIATCLALTEFMISGRNVLFFD